MLHGERWRLLGIVAVILVVGSARVDAQTDSITPIDSKCDDLCEVSDKPWRSIPWELDLLAAQKLSVEQSKPIFIWAMDGHPLGCT